MFKKLLGPLLIVVAIVVVVLLVINKPKPETKSEKPQDIIPVAVESISPTTQPLLIKTEGFVDSRWRTTLSAEVSGLVIAVNDNLLLGNSFQKGEVLVTLNPLDYEVKVARSEANIKAAQSNLVEQEMQASRAKSDWQKLNPNRAPSDFNLRLPQLRKAESDLQATQQELKLAQENLNRTKIKAPFQGFAISRSVDLGEILQTGTEIARIVANEKLQLRVSVKASEAKLLQQSSDYQINFYDSNGNWHQEWRVDNIRFEPFIDSENRFRSLILNLDNTPDAPLVGEFIKVEITTEYNRALLAIPESALSVSGQLWYVDKQNLTNRFNPSLIYQADGMLYAEIDDALNYPLALIIAPPNSLLKGVQVKPETWNQQSSAASNSDDE